MRTLTEIKDFVAKDHGYHDYETALKMFREGVISENSFNDFMDDVLKEVAKESLKNASENVKLTISEFSKRKDNSIGWNEITLKENLYIINDGCNIVANKQSILNESNIPEL